MIQHSGGFRYGIHSKWGLYGILKGSDLEKQVFSSDATHAEAMNAIEHKGLCIISEEIKTKIGVATKIDETNRQQVINFEEALKDHLQQSWRYRRLVSECKRTHPNHIVVLLYELIDFQHIPVVLSFPTALANPHEETQAYRPGVYTAST